MYYNSLIFFRKVRVYIIFNFIMWIFSSFGYLVIYDIDVLYCIVVLENKILICF